MVTSPKPRRAEPTVHRSGSLLVPRPMRWALLALCLACSGDTERLPDTVDGGAPGLADATTRSDAGIGSTQPGIPPTDNPEIVQSPDTFEDAADPSNAGACYDTLDNDGDSASDGVDCADANCATLPSCCVGSSTEACCIAATAEEVTAGLSACEGSTPESCIPTATPFGAPRPIVSGGILLGGDGQDDSGLLFEAPHDLRTERLVLEADVQQATDCGAGCLESVAFGVTRQTSIGDSDLVDPLVALVISGPLQQARLVVGGSVVAQWPAERDDSWTLELRPSGEVWVGRADEPAQPAARFHPLSDTRVVTWGHNRNPSATETRAARLRSLTITAALCDIPTAWRDRAPLRVEHSLPLDTEGASSPTLLLDGDVPMLAYEWKGALYAARAPSDPNRYFTTTAAPGEALRMPTPSRRVRSPELVHGPDTTWLYFVQEAEDGVSLQRAPLTDEGARLGDSIATNLALEPGAADMGEPTIVPIMPAERPERWAMVLRIGEELTAFASVDGLSWTPTSTLPTAELYADELREPSLVIVNGGYQLFLSVRHGTRWRQALFASAELLYWRLVDDRALEGEGDGRESLGVRDLDIVNRGGSLEVVYVGLDGARETLHRATRPIPQIF